MKLKELLDTGTIQSFNLDVIGMKCNWLNPEHTDIRYSGDITHDYCELTKDTIDPKYLEYSVVRVGGYDDGLYITIDVSASSK